MPRHKPATFEETYSQLDEAVRKLEAGGLSLEESIGLYERGMELASLLEKQLEQAEARIRKLKPDTLELEIVDQDMVSPDDEG